MKTKLLYTVIMAFIGYSANAQCQYFPATSSVLDTLTWSLSGGAFASNGCSPIDPNYWITGFGDSATATFVNPQAYPAFRIWGMNDDDSAAVSVNGIYYSLNSLTASYNVKTVCGLSPGPDGVAFSSGNLVGVNDNIQGNYSYQDVTLHTSNVSTITVKGLKGAGWGFAGVSLYCALQTALTELDTRSRLSIYPNPFNSSAIIQINPTAVNTELTIYNVCGQKLKTISNISSGLTTLERGNLQSGIYFIRLTENNQTIATDKLIITDL